MKRSWTIVSICAVVITALFSCTMFHCIAPRPSFIFDASIPEIDRTFLETALADIPLSQNLTISLISDTHAITSDNLLLANVLVPVVDWNSGTTSIGSLAEASELVSISELDASKRLVAVDGEYYLDTFISGAKFIYYQFISDSIDDIATVIAHLRTWLPELPSQDSVLAFAQTGVSALSRRMNAKLYNLIATGKDASYFAKYISPYFQRFDFVHTSNESSFSPLASSSNICSDARMINALTAINLNIVELTGNHNTDCGANSALSTISTYKELGIQYFGGGKNASDASVPLTLFEKNTQITLLGYNESTGGYTTGNLPGANKYSEQQAKSDISRAKSHDDFVIVDVQYYECNDYASTYEDTTCDYPNSDAIKGQVALFRKLIDLGADIVVGTSAHQPQSFEQYKDGYIYYGLGNLFFDQSTWPGTTRSLILAHYFWNGKLLQTRLVPTAYDNNFQTKILDSSTAANFLERLLHAQPKQ